MSSILFCFYNQIKKFYFTQKFYSRFYEISYLFSLLTFLLSLMLFLTRVQLSALQVYLKFTLWTWNSRTRRIHKCVFCVLFQINEVSFSPTVASVDCILTKVLYKKFTVQSINCGKFENGAMPSCFAWPLFANWLL